MSSIHVRTQSPPASLTPLIIALGFISFTYILFCIAPFNWPVPSYSKLLIVILLSMTAITVGYALGRRAPPVSAKTLPVRRIVISGGLIAFIVLFPSAQTYAGRWPWEVLDALGDQKAAYQGLGEQLRATAGQRGPIAALRAFSAPLAFGAIVLGILNWGRIGWLGRIAVGLAVGSSLTFSILRGTNKEVVDTTIVILTALVIIFARKRKLAVMLNAQSGSVFKQFLFAIGFMLLMALVLSMFLSRISGRLDHADFICLGLSEICSDFSGEVYSQLPIEISRSVAMICSYLGQGYFGLSLALEEPFSSGLGMAHSPAISSLFIQLGGSEAFIRETYPYRLLYQAWDPDVQWTSMLTWLAADFSFPGAISLLTLLGYALVRGWKSAVHGGNDLAAGLFIIAVLTCFYFPANFQATITFDSYLLLLTVSFLYKFWRP